MSWPRTIVAFGVISASLWFFGNAVFRGDVIAYRDAANYYRPLFQWECQQWRSARLPLWNPQDNCGTPVLADTSTSVLYPGKLLFALPLDFNRRFNLYIAIHFLLAVASAYLVARRFGRSVPAAGICAVSYACAGSVLFQYANVIFLVGAAWLPLAFLAADRLLRRQHLGWALAYGAVLALMTLGGDPQLAYHTLLLTAFYAVIFWWTLRGKTKEAAGQLRVSMAHLSLLRAILLLLIAASCAFGFAAVQVLPAMEWTQRSERVVYECPRNVLEVVEWLRVSRSASNDANQHDAKWPGVRRGIFGAPPGETHHQFVYRYSVGPWRLLELLWPNVSGKIFPTNRRWISLLPAEGRTWVPSLYMGLLPFILGIFGWCAGRNTPRARWLAWSAVLATLGSFGWYGLGWMIHELRVGAWGVAENDVIVGQPVGGVYWLLVVLLPGYVYFRYPAKLLVVAAFCWSLLAARGWDAVAAKQPWKLARFALVLGLASLALLVAARLLQAQWMPLLDNAPTDAIFGPLDRAGAARDIQGALLHTGLVCAALWGLCRYVVRRRSRLAALAAFALTVLDLAVANGWMVATVPADSLLPHAPVSGRLADVPQPADASVGRIYRSAIHEWIPAEWGRQISPSRLSDVFRWERDSLRPRHHLPAGLHLVESNSSLTSYDYRLLLQVARTHGESSQSSLPEPHPAILGALSARYRLAPSTERAPSNLRPVVTPGNESRVSLWENSAARANAWIVHEVEFLKPLRSKRIRDIVRRTEAVFFPEGRIRDLSSTAVVEHEAAPASRVELPGVSPDGESCVVTRREPTFLEVQARLRAPGLVVVNDVHYPGWVANVWTEGNPNGRSVPVWRVNRVMRGVMLESGDHRVVFEYRPRSFLVGAGVSLASWLLLPGVYWWQRQRRRRGRRSTLAAGFRV